MPTLLPNGITITDAQLATLKDTILDPEQWIRDALIGRLVHCEKTMDEKWRSVLDADPQVETVPANRTKRIELILARSDYQDRAARIEAGKEE